MRIYFDSMAHPKRLSKRLSKAANIKLSLAQETVAGMFGYADWHELGAVTEHGKHAPSKPDRYCSNAVVNTRRGFQMNALFDQIANEVPSPVDFANLLMNLHPTDSYSTRDEIEAGRICDLIFPTAQTFEWRPEGQLLMTLEVAGADDGEEAAQANGGATEDFSDRTLRTLKWFDPVKQGADGKTRKPFAVAVCSIVPIIEENIILSVEVRFHSLSLASDSARRMGYAAKLICSFLNSPFLLPTAKGDLSGAGEGIAVILSGDIKTVRGSEFLAEYLIPLLEDTALDNKMAEDIWDEAPIGILPIRELKTDDLFLKEDEDLPSVRPVNWTRREERKPITTQQMAMLDQLTQLKKDLMSYLRARGLPGEASTFFGHGWSDDDDLRDFLQEIRSLASVNKIPESVGMYCRWVAINYCMIMEMKEEEYLQFKDSDRKDPAIRIAKRLGDDELASILDRPGGMESVENSYASGQLLLYRHSAN